MKKIIISLLLLSSVCFMPMVAKADIAPINVQTLTAPQKELYISLLEQIISLLQQLIVLQNQQATSVNVSPTPAPVDNGSTVAPVSPAPKPETAPGSVQAPQTISLSPFSFADQSANFRKGLTTTLYSFAITNNNDADISTQQLTFAIVLNSAEGKTLSNGSFKLFRDPSFTGTGSVSVSSWDNSTIVLGIAKTTIKTGQSVIFTLYTTPNVFFKAGDTISTSLVDDGNGNSLGSVIITAQ